ncbi:hypothetical protein Sjap_012965 [Stephania japonica]|uniref:Uncharacterized protein n=1 Tax=Stephania japonica TaxID=461633 RepID=A0AAP0IYU2_9MAGN
MNFGLHKKDGSDGASLHPASDASKAQLIGEKNWIQPKKSLDKRDESPPRRPTNYNNYKQKTKSHQHETNNNSGATNTRRRKLN